MNSSLVRLALICAALALVSGPLRAGGEDQTPRRLPALIDADLVIDGDWVMDRDLVVAPGATLRMRAGTTIRVASTDTDAAGEDPEHCELRVYGRLLVNGDTDRPVEIASARPTDTRHPLWMGISLYADRQREPDSVLRGLKLRGASQGVQVTDGVPRLERCVFYECSTGVAAGRFWRADRALSEEAREPQPEIIDCVFVACGTGVYTEGSGAPVIRRSSFLGCQLGVGNERRRWFTASPSSVGAHADRCLFLRNAIAVGGSSVIENSIFLRNRTAFEVTRLHGHFSSTINRIAWRRNVLWRNDKVAEGESDIGAEQLLLDPELESEPTVMSFDAATAPLRRVALSADSPCRGAALDGGDLGPTGSGPVGRSTRRWASAPAAFRRVLVLGPPDRIGRGRLPTIAPKSAGERVGAAWWAAFDVDESGLIERLSLRWPEEREDIPLAYLWEGETGSEPTAGALEVNSDGFCRVWHAKAELPFPTTNLRAGTRGVPVDVPAATTGGVVLWWRSTDLVPRLGVAARLREGDVLREAGPTSEPAEIAAQPMRFGSRFVGFRLTTPFHWDDLRTPGVFSIRTSDGTTRDLLRHGLELRDKRGTLRAEVPDGASKSGAVFVIDGLRDPWGRTLRGQPFELAAETPR